MRFTRMNSTCEAISGRARAALEAPCAAQEVLLLPRLGKAQHRGERIHALARRGDDLRVEVGPHHAEALAQDVGEAHGDRVRLLARGAAGAPHAEGLSRLRRLARVFGEDAEVVRLAVERGHVRRERIGAMLPLRRLVFEELHVVVERGEAERAQAPREARVDHLALSLGQPDAGELVDPVADEPEVLHRERELAFGHRAHASAFAAARAPTLRVKALTSRMRATRPSPRIVAPAMPGTRCRFVSSDFTTSCCWPIRLSTSSAARRLSTSTTRQRGSARVASEAGSCTTSSRRTMGRYSPRTATSEGWLTIVLMSPAAGLKASATNSSGMMYCSSATLTIIPSSTASVRGSWIVITVPSPFADEIETLPPSALMLRRTTSMPTPRPERLVTSFAVEKPASKRISKTSSSPIDSSAWMPSSRALAMMRSRSMPRPSSETSMMTLPPRCVARMPTVPLSGLPRARRSAG